MVNFLGSNIDELLRRDKVDRCHAKIEVIDPQCLAEIQFFLVHFPTRNAVMRVQ